MKKKGMEKATNWPYTQNSKRCEKMRNRKPCLIFVLNLIFIIAPCMVLAAQAPDPMALEQERRIKEDTESKAQMIVDSIFGKGKASILANVELGLESSKKGGSALNRKLEGKAGSGNDDENYILPWVPAPKSVNNEDVPKDANLETQAAQQETVDIRTVVKRFDITVVHDDSIPEAQVDLAKTTLESAFDRYRGILKLFFRATQFMKDPGFNGKEVVQKNLWDALNFKNFLLLFLLMMAFYLLKFFFGPLAKFMQDYVEGMKERAKSDVQMENKSETENETDENAESENAEGEGELTEEELAALEAQEAEMEKFVPFSFINDVNVKQLAYLLHHEEPWVIAMVISYLSKEHSFKVMEALPADLQARVALETAMYRQTSEDQVVAIDNDIKQKIDFVVGGLEKLVTILESSDRFSRENILEYLKNEKPSLYDRVRERVLIFEDIGKFPKMAMQHVVRELKTEELAKALRGASPELQQNFFENMSQGAVTLLKEEMEYGPPVTQDQIEEERRKIIDHIKTLENDGKISFRQKGNTSSLTSDEIAGDMSSLQIGSLMNGSTVSAADSEAAVESYNAGLAASESGDSETALQYFEQSVRQDPGLGVAQQALGNMYYGMQRYEEALQAFEAALQIEPNDELQTWVDEFRTSLSTPAS